MHTIINYWFHYYSYQKSFKIVKSFKFLLPFLPFQNFWKLYNYLGYFHAKYFLFVSWIVSAQISFLDFLILSPAFPWTRQLKTFLVTGPQPHFGRKTTKIGHKNILTNVVICYQFQQSLIIRTRIIYNFFSKKVVIWAWLPKAPSLKTSTSLSFFFYFFTFGFLGLFTVGFSNSLIISLTLLVQGWI